MKKLKLNLDEIKVESFETNAVRNNNGTIIGDALPSDVCLPSPNGSCIENTCLCYTYVQTYCPTDVNCPTINGAQTCDAQCNYTFYGDLITCDSCAAYPPGDPCTGVTMNICGPRCS